MDMRKTCIWKCPLNCPEREGQPIRRSPPPHSFPPTSFTPSLRSMPEGEHLTNTKSWQAGDLVLHHKLSVAWRGLTAYSPVEHVFPCSTSNLPFLPVTTLDQRGRPWTSILAGKDGKPGFTSHSPCKTELEIMAHLWEGDPLHAFRDIPRINGGAEPVSGIGIELRARKSYRKFAGTLVELTRVGEAGMKLRLKVNQTLRYGRIMRGPALPLTTSSSTKKALPKVHHNSRPRASFEHGARRSLQQL